jgi:hypothetical protein
MTVSDLYKFNYIVVKKRSIGEVRGIQKVEPKTKLLKPLSWNKKNYIVAGQKYLNDKKFSIVRFINELIDKYEIEEELIFYLFIYCIFICIFIFAHSCSNSFT